MQVVFMEHKKKHKVLRMKTISREDITPVDAYTYYVPSSDPEKEPYFVYKEHINRDRWLCECENFIFNLKDTNDAPTHQCKHIKAVINSFFTEHS